MTKDTPFAPEPIVPVEITTPQRPEGYKEDRVTVFSIDGTDYTVPARPRPNIAVRFLWRQKEAGVMQAASELLESMLGTEGFKALSEYDDLTDEQFSQVLAIVQKVALGSLEKATGN
jgi:hypothetical protein